MVEIDNNSNRFDNTEEIHRKQNLISHAKLFLDPEYRKQKYQMNDSTMERIITSISNQIQISAIKPPKEAKPKIAKISRQTQNKSDTTEFSSSEGTLNKNSSEKKEAFSKRIEIDESDESDRASKKNFRKYQK